MIRFVSRHRKVVGGAAFLGFALIVFVLAYFQPQKLFINKTVNEAAPSAPVPAAAGAPTSRPLEGTFRSFEHPTSGRAVVITGGRRVLRLENFRTSNGPDVVVYLTAVAPASVGDVGVVRDFVDLGSLKGNIGDQNYTIPSGTDLGRYSNVVVWCRRFKVAFGAAKLS